MHPTAEIADGRIKVIGGDNIEGLFVSPKQLTFKNLEFLRNQGFLVNISNENEIQVWDLEHRRINSTFRWESNITAFSVIHSTSYMYLGDEYGMVSVLKKESLHNCHIMFPQMSLLMLCLDWSSRIESLKCVGRVDLTLSGLFANLGGMESCDTLLFVLSNLGQLDVYDDSCLSSLMSRKEKWTSASSLQYPTVIPTIEPYMIGKAWFGS
ncbi:hypothetical protein LWI29_004894 [Acer saccharum]|uniref:Uncharacterized protein n=1 Tax=Acer saccharum TaxID=4024 RepID=A0AA39VNZ0_ACESA|nr:hypothetical protein LWI29_004894 [Acer saccharum]